MIIAYDRQGNINGLVGYKFVTEWMQYYKECWWRERNIFVGNILFLLHWKNKTKQNNASVHPFNENPQKQKYICIRMQ